MYTFLTKGKRLPTSFPLLRQRHKAHKTQRHRVSLSNPMSLSFIEMRPLRRFCLSVVSSVCLFAMQNYINFR